MYNLKRKTLKFIIVCGFSFCKPVTVLETVCKFEYTNVQNYLFVNTSLRYHLNET